ncbi:MAG: hypothetical protein FJ146_04615 [Deltaproteobacteria bacterium]|nr:hypothetical protein [Deltaproteobacteria bacterium]
METANVVFEHPFDKTTLEQINDLRRLRLSMAETMLQDVSGTGGSLRERGLASDFSNDELRQELMMRVCELRSRLSEPNVIYADEIDFYIDLMDQNPDD